MTPTIARTTTPIHPNTIALSPKRSVQVYLVNRGCLLTYEIAPYLTGLINGVGWQSGFPRTMTVRDIDHLVESSHGEMRLAAIQDVSCDIKVSRPFAKAHVQGGLEFIDRHTTIGSPYFEGPGGMLISTTDILPTELR